MSTDQLDASMTSLNQDINSLKDKVDMLSNENHDLDDEIIMIKSSLQRAQKDFETKENQVKNLKTIEALAEEEKKAQIDLEATQKKVEAYLELTEELEEKDMFDQEKTAKLLLQEREEKEALLKSIQADLDIKLKELGRLRQDVESS